jgi:hypothetical protein
MPGRRVLVLARDQADALRRLAGWQSEPDPKVELVDGRWAVTAAKKGV